jgi:hypothetical protein
MEALPINLLGLITFFLTKIWLSTKYVLKIIIAVLESHEIK